MPPRIRKPHDKGVICSEFVNDYVTKDDMELFRTEIANIIKYINRNPGVNEEPVKGELQSFLNKFYKNEYKVAIPPKGYRADLQIYNGKTEIDPVSVIIETKKPDAGKKDMISLDQNKKHCNLNSKAFHELVGYYLDHENMKLQIPLSHLIATNGFDWFIFNEDNFHEFVYKNKEINEIYQRFKDDRERFYAELSKNYDFFNKEWDVIHFNLKDYFEDLVMDNINDISTKLFQLYKLFSPYTLLNKPLPSNDSNALNKKFYRELLHIMGLSENEKDRTINRLKEGKRDPGSLIENIITQVNDFQETFDSNDFSEYGQSNDEQKFNICLELLLTWLNRILFIKLLEGQLLRYGKLKNKFMTWGSVNSYDEINRLFFKVLKFPIAEREPHISEKYKDIPYLNSSLFDMTELERKFITISDLDDIPLSYYSNSVLSKGTGEKINSCKYLLQFLDSYDFSSDQSKIFKNENKDKLINASVLGLIFEKINAYSDGAVFTPGIITSYICRETIRKSIVKKFNESEFPGAGKLETIQDIRNVLREEPRYKGDFSNDIINSLRICDPAVGSGHFLVSALNEIILIKSELGLLRDKYKNRLDVDAKIVNDELIFIKEDGSQFSYNPGNRNSQIIQEAIFGEKYQIITKCLYGVDLNPKSVSICRLRLWIELLKHAYYKPDKNGIALTSNELQVLPNIDVNIRCGNSLLSHYSLDTKYDILVENGIVPNLDKYKKSTNEYRKSVDRAGKLILKKELDAVTSNCKSKQKKLDELLKTRDKKETELKNTINQMSIFQWSGDNDDLRNKKIVELKKKIASLSDTIEKLQKYEKLDAAYSNAFEWRLYFPDILDKDGNFVGFDCIIGNPPYIQLQHLSDETCKKLYEEKYSSYDSKGDVFCLFYEQGINLLKEGGILGYISSNKWMKGKYGKNLRGYLAKNTNPIYLIDFPTKTIFDEANVQVNILILERGINKGLTKSLVATKEWNGDTNNNNEDLVKSYTNDDPWLIMDPMEEKIKEKMEKIGTPLSKWPIQMSYGIKTGRNKAYIINKELRDEYVSKDSRNEEIIKPFISGPDIKRYSYSFNDEYILLAKYNSHKYLQAKYPVVYNHLSNYKDILMTRGQVKYTSSGKTRIGGEYPGQHHWIELDNNPDDDYLNGFNQKKIAWGNLCLSAQFSLIDEGFVINAPATFLLTDDYYILAVLNSKISDWYIRSLGVIRNGGYFEYKPIFVSQLPIPDIPENDKDEFRKIVSEILNNKGNHEYQIELEDKINSLLYNIFKLDEDEINYIDSKKFSD